MHTGLCFGLMATLLWGSYPLWYKPLAGTNPWELLSWRIVFAELFVVSLIFITGRRTELMRTIKQTSVKNLLYVSSVLGLWWFVYIYGIVTDRVLEVALGYFLSPLMSIAVSRFVFKENMTVIQRTAVFFATSGVVLMAFKTLDGSSFPWVALIIGFCFSFYGIFKKRVTGDPVVLQTLEIAILLPFAVGFLTFANLKGNTHQFNQSLLHDFLLISTGIITVLPLWWYSQAARQLPVMALGFLQFIPPSCNFLLAIFMYGEIVDPYRLLVFGLIWSGLFIFTCGSLIQSRLLSNSPLHRRA